MKRRRELILLALVLLVFAAVATYQWRRIADEGTRPGAAAPAAAAARRVPAGARLTVPDVKLGALAAARNRPAPGPAERNLFRFQAKAAPPAAAGGGSGPGQPAAPGAAGVPGAPGAPAGVAPDQPAPPPPPPPITLKFIGIVAAPDKKLAVLTDPATRDVFYGREGDIVDGRFRILKIGVESIEMAYVDGRGRQSIRLSGS
jgi:hypothetical protein